MINSETKYISNFDTKALNYISYFTDPRETDRIQTDSYLQLPILKESRVCFESVSIRCYFFFNKKNSFSILFFQ